MIRRITFYFSLGILSLLLSCSTQPKLLSTVYSSTKIIEGSDPAADSLIYPYKNSLDREMNEVLGISENPMVKGLPESPLGNFVSDLVLIQSRKIYGNHIDICMLNNGGLRSSLPGGEITRGKIYELMPFENEIVVLTMTGEKLNDMFDYISYAGGVPLSGATLKIVNKKPVEIKINGQPFDPAKNYKVATSDYLAAGGDKMRFFNEPVKRESTGLKIRDAIIDYIKEKNKNGEKISSEKDGRITVER